ncbi:phosphate ABC transporter permease subunit PstC [Actinospica durhamensis]|uniref:Phosphate transport system permease protein n=1 Tax=Actinospica durhamensis TaxID=1508375 RepID=A0A941ES38_9ACTN|nr:phosphate ABC transporter permease subunit PstC [Actinospica durhamensis]MBR7836485.1 phosphate ABC transporter permease subunit PstC [Actinospica durhamensis]
MADTTPTEALGPPLSGAAEVPDVPRQIVARLSGADRAFRALLRGGGLAVFAITGLIGGFLLYRAWDTFRVAGWKFFTTSTWLLGSNHFGIASVLPNGLVIALTALVVAVPCALTAALFISEYAPAVLKRPLVALIDLMAAIPSIVYALWGVFFLQPRILGFSRWLSDHLGGVFPPFKVVGGDMQILFQASPFVAGLIISLMVIPIITSICREVFSQAPSGEREGAYALGASRWGMIRTVVLPYGRGGMIGAIMLGFGRAMGETIVVALFISPVYVFNWHVLHTGGLSIPGLIALWYSESTPTMISALMAAGLVLFVLTLIVNAVAGVIITRSRSGAQTAD